MIKTAEFIGSFPQHKLCPEPSIPEFAFIGRSNVGKSSLINMLTNRKNLAKTSQTPGKTKTINHFLINQSWYLVDLPGYGWAKVSKQDKIAWQKMINDYILQRSNLKCVMVLIDSRLTPQKIDLEFMEWLGINHIPFVMIFTKTDKVRKNDLAKHIKNYKNTMLEHWESHPKYFLTSSINKNGQEDVLDFIHTLLG